MLKSVKSDSDLNHFKLKENCFKIFFKRHLKLKANYKETKSEENRKLDLLCIEFVNNRSVDKVVRTQINRSIEVH
jgi:hypothetical protein